MKANLQRMVAIESTRQVSTDHIVINVIKGLSHFSRLYKSTSRQRLLNQSLDERLLKPRYNTKASMYSCVNTGLWTLNLFLCLADSTLSVTFIHWGTN